MASAAIALSAGCESEPDYAALNRPTKEAQLALVAGLEPVQPKMRFRRTLPTEPGLPAQEGYYDWRGTEKEAAWLVAKAEIAANIADSDWPAEYDENVKTRVVRVMDGEEWELEYDNAELAALGALAKERGINNASTHDDEQEAALPADEPEAELQGWDNGIDSRVAKPISQGYPSNQRELRRIGRLDNGCSAVAVGRRLLLTAAHCVTNPDALPAVVSYSARQSNTTKPYGTVSSTGVHFDISSHWYANDCHIQRTTICNQYDWAIVFLPDTVWQGQTHPGWMGYSAPSDWSYYENNNAIYESGYPVEWTCYPPMSRAWSGVPAGMLDANGEPIPSKRWVAYGNTAAVTVRDLEYIYNGDPRLVHTGNDISCGHSGAAIWSDHPGSNGPYALGVNVYERCAAATCGQATGTTRTHPNGVRALTPVLEDMISDYRVAYP